jgi:predicted esterase
MGLSGDHAFRDKRAGKAGTTRLRLGRRGPRASRRTESAGLPVPWAPSASVTSSASVVPSPSVSADPSKFELDLELEKYVDPLVVEPPPRVGTRFPVVVAVHGLNSTPESLCDPLREAIGPRTFVLCPVGSFTSYENGQPMYQFVSADKIWDEVEAGLEALSARFGAQVDVKHPIYLGFSQGSILGAEVVVRDGDVERAIFVEGGQDTWVRSHVDAFERHGGRRVLYVTGSEYWEIRAKASVPEFNGSNVSVLHVHVDGEGHHFSPKIVDAVAQRLDWLMEGDPRLALE